MERVLVTGASTPLGQRITAALRGHPGVCRVLGVDVRAGRVVPLDGDAPSAGAPAIALAAMVDAEPIDTVVHAGMCPGRAGVARYGMVDVVATQQLAAALGDRGSPVRTVVAVSSTEVFTPSSAAPAWRRAAEELRAAPGSAAGPALEAEGYLRDLAEHQPQMCVAILRLADLAGPGVAGALSALCRRTVPYVAGYDPQVQLLHVDDAVRAVVHAADRELAGTFNVAGAGSLPWRTLARLAGGTPLPGAVAPARWAASAAGLGLPCVPTDLVDLLRFGRCVDTAALAATGFEPEHSTAACASATAHV